MTATRRQTLALWAVPAIAVAVPAPAFAISGILTFEVIDNGNVANGVDVYLRDRKFRASVTSPPNYNYQTTDRLVLLQVRVLLDGVPLTGVQVTFAGDSTKDIEGNYLIGFGPSTQNTNLNESSTQRTTTATTDVNGIATVVVATATLALSEPATVAGTFSVNVASGPTWPAGSDTYTYIVFRG